MAGGGQHGTGEHGRRASRQPPDVRIMGGADPPAPECPGYDEVQALVFRGSDYPAAIAKGTRVELIVDKATGRVVVTRGARAVKLGYVAGGPARQIAECLQKGYRYLGEILDSSASPRGTVILLRLDEPEPKGRER